MHEEPLESLEQDFAPPKKQLRVVTFAELVKYEFKPRELILAPWLATQSLSMVHAPRGLGKTHLSLGIAYAVASGGQFLQWEAEKPRGVLFVDGEMPGNALQERLNLIALSGSDSLEAPLHFLTPDLQEFGMPDISTPEGWQQIEDHITDEIELIIIDNLSSLVRSGRENEAESWQPIQDWALSLRARGKSVIFIHHSGKGGQQRGTSRREDVLDNVVKLKPPSDHSIEKGACFEVHFEKSRHVFGDALKPFEARLQEDDNALQSWTIRTVEQSTYEKVVELSGENLSQGEIAVELKVNKSTVSKHIKKARAEGALSHKAASGAG
ncbi:MAG: AAA family ATPase [Gammaproteobacteria bacterium]|nr:AAA family ATPase [Gammaproteobacteria bacterium]